jgi:hypothetical protein
MGRRLVERPGFDDDGVLADVRMEAAQTLPPNRLRCGTWQQPTEKVDIVICTRFTGDTARCRAWNGWCAGQRFDHA